MKIGFVCPKCIADQNENNETRVTKIFANIENIGVYELTCPRGHFTKVLLQDLRHELLFESGAIALIDGYAREAVADFAASVERFHEFVLRVLIKASNISESVMDSEWKDVKKQTERQYGAIIFTCLAVNGKPLPKFDTKWTDFRNRVIHQGEMPTAAKATEYGDYCLQYIFTAMDGLSETCRSALREVLKDHVRKILETPQAAEITSHHLRQTVIQTHLYGTEEFGKYSLRQWMDSVSEHIRLKDSLNGTSL